MRIFFGSMNIPSKFIFQITFCGSLEKASAILCKSDSFNPAMSPKMLPNETKITSWSPSFPMNSSSSFGRGLAGLGRNGPTTRVSIMKQQRTCYRKRYVIIITKRSNNGTAMSWKTIGPPEIKGQWKVPAQLSPCPQTCTTTMMVLNMHK